MSERMGGCMRMGCVGQHVECGTGGGAWGVRVGGTRRAGGGRAWGMGRARGMGRRCVSECMGSVGQHVLSAQGARVLGVRVGGTGRAGGGRAWGTGRARGATVWGSVVVSRMRAGSSSRRWYGRWFERGVEVAAYGPCMHARGRSASRQRLPGGVCVRRDEVARRSLLRRTLAQLRRAARASREGRHYGALAQRMHARTACTRALRWAPAVGGAGGAALLSGWAQGGCSWGLLVP
jgi:hypothetical protein